MNQTPHVDISGFDSHNEHISGPVAKGTGLRGASHRRVRGSENYVALAGKCSARELRARAALVLGGIAVLAALVFGGCSDEVAAKHALEAEGFTQIETTGWEAFGCAKDDGTCTGFHAVGPTGRRVDGVVGCGLFFKGCTVRIK